jgi:hypothetical protein
VERIWGELDRDKLVKDELERNLFTGKENTIDLEKRIFELEKAVSIEV